MLCAYSWGPASAVKPGVVAHTTEGRGDKAQNREDPRMQGLRLKAREKM